MSFGKGQSGNPEGRPQGTKNKVDENIREQIKSVISSHFSPEQISNELKQMDAKDKLTFYFKLLEFIVPKKRQTDTEIDINSPHQMTILTTMTSEQLKESLKN